MSQELPHLGRHRLTQARSAVPVLPAHGDMRALPIIQTAPGKHCHHPLSRQPQLGTLWSRCWAPPKAPALDRADQKLRADPTPISALTSDSIPAHHSALAQLSSPVSSCFYEETEAGDRNDLPKLWLWAGELGQHSHEARLQSPLRWTEDPYSPGPRAKQDAQVWRVPWCRSLVALLRGKGQEEKHPSS